MENPPVSSIEIEIPFHDVDSMHIVWHGHYSKYFELARCKLLESFGYCYKTMAKSGYAWPVIDMRIKYVKPAVFGQNIRVTAKLKEWEYRLKIDYLIQDVDTGAKLTKGYTVQVAVDRESGDMLYESPPVLLEKLGLKSPGTQA